MPSTRTKKQGERYSAETLVDGVLAVPVDQVEASIDHLVDVPPSAGATGAVLEVQQSTDLVTGPEDIVDILLCV